MLWEAVRTKWHTSPGRARSSLPEQLVDHTDHILRNQFREELGLSADPRVDPESNTTTASVSEASVEVDGEERPAMQIDTDPLVYSIGFPIDEQVTCTAVIPGMRSPSLTSPSRDSRRDLRLRRAPTPATGSRCIPPPSGRRTTRAAAR